MVKGMPRQIITLTTDFGTSDHFVGTMKGVILSITPTANLVDITHEIRPFEVSEAAFVMAQFYAFFPKGTIHVVVVDPGVGSTRRPILAEVSGQYFIAPDNGVLSMVLAKAQASAKRASVKVRHITSEKFFLKALSRTFHGRDVFAPVAAHLAKGIPPAQFGKSIDDFITLSSLKPEHTGEQAWTGTLLKVDRFGNLITNFHIDEFPQVKTKPFELRIGTAKIKRLALTFTECDPDELFLIVGSSGYLEVATNQGNAAEGLGSGAGSLVELKIG